MLTTRIRRGPISCEASGERGGIGIQFALYAKVVYDACLVDVYARQVSIIVSVMRERHGFCL